MEPRRCRAHGGPGTRAARYSRRGSPTEVSDVPSPLPRYRACLWYGAAYTGVFVLVAVGRLLLMEDTGSVSLMDAAAVIPGLFFAYAAGCVFALPLVWTLRRFRMNPRVPIALWLLPFPFRLSAACSEACSARPASCYWEGRPSWPRSAWPLSSRRSGRDSARERRAAEPASGSERPICTEHQMELRGTVWNG